MQILDINTIKKHLTMPMAIKAIEELLILETKHPDWIKTPDRLVIPTFTGSNKHQSGSHLSMPCVVFDGEQEFAVVKLVTICPDNPQRGLPTTVATVIVSDNATGETLAFMDGIYITQVRTAALSGIATKHLAEADSRIVAVIGTGGMAYEQLNAVLTVCPRITQVNLWNRNIDSAHDFKSKFPLQYPQWSVNMTVVEDMSAAIKDADIINMATRSEKGLFEADQIKPTAHINAIGAYQPSMKEVSDSVLEASTHVFIDDIEGGRHEAGGLIQANDNEQTYWTWADLTGSLADLVNGKGATKSETDKEDFDKKDSDKKGISVFKSVGSASFDAAVALKVTKMAEEAKDGVSVEL